ncbi:MAG TPA: hypothetical protein VF396_00375, partial [Bradyrhizobium sp.]
GMIRPGFCRGDRTTSERDGIGIFFRSSFDKTPDQYGHPDDVALGHQGCKCHVILFRRHPFPSSVEGAAAASVTLF